MPGSPSRRLRESSVRLLLPKLAGSRQRVAPLSFAMDRRHPEPFPLACVGPLLAVTYLVEVSRIRLNSSRHPLDRRVGPGSPTGPTQ